MNIKGDVMVNFLHHQQQERMWANGGQSEGVVLKKSRDNYICCPPELSHYQGDFYDAVRALNVRVCRRRTTSRLVSNRGLGRDDSQHQNSQSFDATR